MRILRASEGGGQREATTWPGGGEVPPSREAFVLGTRLGSLPSFGSSSSPRGATGLPPGVCPQLCEGGALRLG